MTRKRKNRKWEKWSPPIALGEMICRSVDRDPLPTDTHINGLKRTVDENGDVHYRNEMIPITIGKIWINHASGDWFILKEIKERIAVWEKYREGVL